MFLINKALLSFPELFKQEINKTTQHQIGITEIAKKLDAGDVDWEGEGEHRIKLKLL